MHTHICAHACKCTDRTKRGEFTRLFPHHPWGKNHTCFICVPEKRPLLGSQQVPSNFSFSSSVCIPPTPGSLWCQSLLFPVLLTHITPGTFQGERRPQSPPGITSFSTTSVLQFVFVVVFIFLTNYLLYFAILYWFCHSLTWIRHECTCVPHPEPPSHLPPHPIPLTAGLLVLASQFPFIWNGPYFPFDPFIFIYFWNSLLKIHIEGNPFFSVWCPRKAGLSDGRMQSCSHNHSQDTEQGRHLQRGLALGLWRSVPLGPPTPGPLDLFSVTVIPLFL